MKHSTALQMEKLGTIEKKGTSYLWVQWKNGIYHKDNVKIELLHLLLSFICHKTKFNIECFKILYCLKLNLSGQQQQG